MLPRPQNPQGDGPEITGAREWPALRAWLKPFLWDPIYAYMGLTVVLDEAAWAGQERFNVAST